MSRTHSPALICMLAGLLLVQLGYAAHHFPDYPVRPAGEYAVKVERFGLTIGVEPVEELKDQKTYFNTELTPKGFIPVFIVIQNGSSKDSFIFQRTNVGYVVVSNNPVADGQSEENAVTDVMNVPGMSPWKLGGASEIEKNILEKEVQSKTLAPGASAHGFLYIPVPRKGARGKVHLQVAITKAGTNETHVYNLFF